MFSNSASASIWLILILTIRGCYIAGSIQCQRLGANFIFPAISGHFRPFHAAADSMQHSTEAGIKKVNIGIMLGACRRV